MASPRLLSVALSAAAIVVMASTTVAQPAAPRSGASPESAASGAPDVTPEVNVRFDASATGLEQGAIRETIARELAKAEVKGEGRSGEITISVAGPHLVVRFHSSEGVVERALPVPNERETIPELLGFAAVNLTHDQRTVAGASRDGPSPGASGRDAPAPHPSKPEPRTDLPKAPAAFARHWFGIHLGSAQLIFNGGPVCQPGADPSYTCYAYSGPQRGQPYVSSTKSDGLAIHGGSTGPHRTQARLLLSFDEALSARFTVGGRVGYAFTNGWLGGPDQYSDGRSGGLLLPLHLEARAKWWLLPLTARHLRAFVGAGGGVAEFAGHETASDATASFEVWKQSGKGFVSADAGLQLGILRGLAVEGSLDANLLFPKTGAAIGFYIGLLYGL